MSSEPTLFYVVPIGAIKILFDEQNHPWFKYTSLGKFIGIPNMCDGATKLSPDEKKSRSKITVCLTDGSFNPTPT